MAIDLLGAAQEKGMRTVPQITASDLVETQPEAEKPGMLQRIGQRVSSAFRESAEEQAKKAVGTAKKSVITGDITDLGLRAAGTAFQAINNIVADTATAAISEVIPDATEDKIKAAVGRIGEGIAKDTRIQGLMALNERFNEMTKQIEEVNPAAAEAIRAQVGPGSLAAEDFMRNLEIAFDVGLGGGTAITGRASKQIARQVAEEGAEGLEKKLTQQILDETLDIIQPDPRSIKKAARVEAIKEGRGVRRGIFKRFELKPDPLDLKVANAVRGIIKKNKSPESNIELLSDEIGRIAKETEAGLLESGVTYKRNELRSFLDARKQESRVLFQNDERLEKAYDSVIDEFMRYMEGNEMVNILRGRKAFDKEVAGRIPRTFTGDAGNNLQRNAILDARRGANDFIASKLPEGNPYKQQLQQQSLMFTAQENIAGNVVAQLGTNAIQRAIKAFWNKVNLNLPLATLGAAGVGISTGALTNPVLLGTLLLGGSVMVGKKALTSKAFKRALIKILEDGADILTLEEKQLAEDLRDAIV